MAIKLFFLQTLLLISLYGCYEGICHFILFIMLTFCTIYGCETLMILLQYT